MSVSVILFKEVRKVRKDRTQLQLFLTFPTFLTSHFIIMQRRKFLQSSCNFCMLATTGFVLPLLSSCTPASLKAMQTDVVNNTIALPLSTLSPTGMQIVHPEGSFYNIAIVRQPNESYIALLLQCTHQENGLTATTNGYTCSLHGSQFSKEGKVTHGPATEPLERYKTHIENGQLIIHLTS